MNDQTWTAWICWDYSDMTPRAHAIFPDEIDALRFAVDTHIPASRLFRSLRANWSCHD